MKSIVAGTCISAMLTIGGLFPRDSCAELPERSRKSLETNRVGHQEQLDLATANLGTAFDDQKRLLLAAKSGDTEAQLMAVADLDIERKAFDSSGILPFSPGMRRAAAAYLVQIGPSERRLMQALDKAATASKQSGDTTLAMDLIREKQQVPRLISKWDCTIREPNGQLRKWQWALYSDGTVNPLADQNNAYPKSWKFGKMDSRIIITNVAIGAPKGGFKDVCTIHPSGQKFEARNQLGGVYTAVRAD